MSADDSQRSAIVLAVEFIGAIGAPGQEVPEALPQVAIAGRSNVGKSSLVNRLVLRKSIARVSGTPGKTREINFYKVNDRFILTDLPGYGYARAPEKERKRWARLINDYLESGNQLLGVILLLDSRRGIMDIDRQLISYLSELGLPALYVLTKIDKLNRAGRTRAVNEVREELDAPADQVLGTSARTGEGVDQLIETVFALVNSATEEDS